MAEPFLLRPWEIGRLTDYQIRVMIEGQRRATESVKGGDKPDPEPYVPPVDLGAGEFVDRVKAREFMAMVERDVNEKRGV